MLKRHMEGNGHFEFSRNIFDSLVFENKNNFTKITSIPYAALTHFIYKISHKYLCKWFQYRMSIIFLVIIM